MQRGVSPPSAVWLPAGRIIVLVNGWRRRCDGGRRGTSLAWHMARLRASAIGKIRGRDQFNELESSPGGALPILRRWRRILRTSGGSVMTAMSFISDPQWAQINGSTS
jgi:hypothetical protein